MKLIRLDITNVRGIRELQLNPDGENFLIWGPNGSGKSAIVDAIDFLLTGKISRLKGEGTGEISFSSHGPHVDSEPEDALVEAVVSVKGLEDPITISRALSEPGVLICDEENRSYLEPALDIAQRDQHVLSRRQIVDFVTSDRSTRGELVNRLLNTKNLEKIRQSLVRAAGILESEVAQRESSVDTTIGTIMTITDLDDFDPETVLKIVNDHRATLQGEEIPKLESERLSQGISAPQILAQEDTETESEINLNTLNQYVDELSDIQNKAAPDTLGEFDKELRKLVTSIAEDQQLWHALQHRRLIQLGIELLDGTGRCPLCLHEWAPSELERHLESRLEDAEEAEELANQISNITRAMTRLISAAQKAISDLEAVCQEFEQENYSRALREWHSELQTHLETLDNPLDHYVEPPVPTEVVASYFAPSDASALLSDLQAFFDKEIPKSTPQQDSWDFINRLEPALKAYESEVANLNLSQQNMQWAASIKDAFVSARDEVLNEIYDEVNGRFQEFYRTIHREDEGDFTSSIQPEGAGVGFKVDFYNRGQNPPHALHSEGHQDSMGLCLFLALSDVLTRDDFDLIVLDDVVMSVDRDHRRYVSSLLNDFFPNRQFLITTHEQAWANQLKSDQVVTSSKMIGLFNWNVETGPKVLYEHVDPWDRIERDLSVGDVPAASARLRRASEHFFGLVCDSLGAEVPFRLTARYHLGELADAARSRLKHLTSKAIKSAKSWGNADLATEIENHYDAAKESFVNTDFQRWKINPTTHFNEWAELPPGEFEQVVDAFIQLFAAFKCNSCGTRLRTVQEGFNDVGVRCDCTDTSWNLKSKE